jgi:hypothetical protein
MGIRIQCLCTDSHGPARIASFWELTLGWRRTRDDGDEVCIEPPEDSQDSGLVPDLLFLKVPEGS